MNVNLCLTVVRVHNNKQNSTLHVALRMELCYRFIESLKMSLLLCQNVESLDLKEILLEVL